MYRKVLSGFVATSALAFLASCVTFSLHPLYDGKTSVFEPGLIGTWISAKSDDKQEKYTFEKGEGNSYKATLFDFSTDPSTDAIFEVHLVRLNGRLFFDAVNTKNRVNGIEAEAGLGIPSHFIGRVLLEGDTLRLDLLNDTWLKDGSKSGKITIRHELVDDSSDSDVLLTASTAELQKFVSEHANDDLAFPSSDPLQRMK